MTDSPTPPAEGTRPGTGLLGGAAMYTLANAANQALPLLLVPLLTRTMPADQFGQVSTFQAVFGAAIAFVGLNANSAVMRAYYDRTREQHAEYTGTAMIIVLASTALALLICLPLSPWIEPAMALPRLALAAAVLTAAGQVASWIALRTWQAERRNVRYLVCQVLSACANVGLTLFLVVALRQGATGRILAIVLTSAITGFAVIAILSRDRAIAWRWRPHDAADVLSYGVPLIPHTVSGWAMSAADRVLLSVMAGPMVTGIYSVGQQLGTGISLIQNSFNQAWMPWFFDIMTKRDATGPARLRRAITLYLLGLMGLSLVVSLLAGPLVRIMAPGSYQGAAAIVPRIAAAFFFAGVYKISANYLFFWKRTGLLAAVTTTAAITQIGVTMLLIRRDGAVGAANGTLLGWIVYAALTTAVVLWLGRRNTGLRTGSGASRT